MSSVNGQPAWVQQLTSRYLDGIGHAFILHFSVRDYVQPGVLLHSYLDQLFKDSEVIVHYDRAAGLSFPLPGMRERFTQLIGLSDNIDPAIAALRAANGQAGQQEELPREPAQALPLLETALRTPQGDNPRRQCVVIIDYAETIVPATDKAAMSPADRTALVTLARLGADPQVAASNNVLILVANNITEIHADLRSASTKYESILVPPPNYDERRAYVQSLIERYNNSEGDGVMIEAGLDVAGLTAGLSRIHIEDTFLRANATDDQTVTIDLIRERKGDILRSEYADVLAPIDPRFGWEAIGGLAHVKNFFNRNVIEPIRAGNRQRVPMGVLMTGPAGTGKSAVAEAVAKEAGINCVLLKPEKILGKYLGEAEQKLEKALRGIDTLAPVLVFIDEIDQKVRRGEGASDGGSQAQNNVFGRLLEYMSDTGHRGQVIFLAASNRPDLLDAALKRPGRFDKKIPFLMPNVTERMDIMAALMRKAGIGYRGAKENEIAAVLTATEGWSGAELEALVVKALEIAQDDGWVALDGSYLLKAVERLSPSTSDVEYMTMIAIRECNDLDLLPEGYRDMLRDRNRLDQRVEQLAPRGRRQL
ncbi:MAG: ATP-binding protein [Dehalococcoidia bacterium]|nr:MAG: ATP-binding protein [Dehalococcoidia bacterium]